MHNSKNNFNSYCLKGFDKNVEIAGLHRFATSLEKQFFSKVTIKNISLLPFKLKLVVELTCNYKLVDALTHFKKEIWGNFSSKKYSFKKELKRLKDANEVFIEVEELSVFLSDTSIIIHRVYHESIPEQLNSIFCKLENSYVNFTRGLEEVPYEIFVPVYEEKYLTYESQKELNIQAGPNCSTHYFSYWGLYFSSEKDAVVYDLKNHLLINSNLQMLTRY